MEELDLIEKNKNNEDNLLELVAILEKVNDSAPGAYLNKVSAHNSFLESKRTDTYDKCSRGRD